MVTSARNRDFHDARQAKKDEFYTQLSDIEKELQHYTDHFAGKVVYLNCDDPRVSNFFRYFVSNFEKLGLKKLIATCYKNNDPDHFSSGESENAVWLEYTGGESGSGAPDASTLPVKTPLVVAADNCTTFSSGLRRTRTSPAHPWDEGSPSFTPFR